jgi:hypothetical protein
MSKITNFATITSETGLSEIIQETGHGGMNLCFSGGVGKLKIQGQEVSSLSMDVNGAKTGKTGFKKAAETTNPKRIHQQGGQGSVNIVINGSAKNITIQSGNKR